MARRCVQPQVQVSRSVLASRLVELWSWGVLSSNSVQYLAEGCVMDGNSTTEVQNLATIGASGLYPQNCRRDLLRRYVGKAGVPQPLVIRTPLLASNGTIELGTTALISPCEMFHRIVTEFPRCAERIWAKEVWSFWEAVPRDDPRILAHNDIDFDRTIPLVLHGDGGRFREKHTIHFSLFPGGPCCVRLSTLALFCYLPCPSRSAAGMPTRVVNPQPICGKPLFIFSTRCTQALSLCRITWASLGLEAANMLIWPGLPLQGASSVQLSGISLAIFHFWQRNWDSLTSTAMILVGFAVAIGPMRLSLMCDKVPNGEGDLCPKRTLFLVCPRIPSGSWQVFPGGACSAT